MQETSLLDLSTVELTVKDKIFGEIQKPIEDMQFRIVESEQLDLIFGNSGYTEIDFQTYNAAKLFFTKALKKFCNEFRRD